MRRSLLKLAVCVVAAAALSTSSAFGDGGRDRAPSTVTARFDQSTMEFVVKGRVESRIGRCERGRRVLIFRENETTQPDDDIMVASGRANRRGRYAISLGDLIILDSYYAKVERKRVRGAVCGGDRSPSISPAGER
ncbi:hypothetical protein HJD18_12240 [Thermoleophilia bacterium SCSIO 60948]|nr:hypothetical protein HJD18_12240 [Thermoleophilia bacterium SCSIO 60948]